MEARFLVVSLLRSGGLGGCGVGYGLFLGSGGQNKHSEGGFRGVLVDAGWVMGFSWVRVVKISIVKVVLGGHYWVIIGSLPVIFGSLWGHHWVIIGSLSCHYWVII